MRSVIIQLSELPRKMNILGVMYNYSKRYERTWAENRKTASVTIALLLLLILMMMLVVVAVAASTLLSSRSSSNAWK